jgi:flavin reductase (DIM6/NTAB) family NADH-FMN oxidoreductase RutF
VNIAHVGIVGMDKVMLSMHKSHYSNNGIKQNKTASVNLVSKDMIVKADYVGMNSGHRVDKSQVFDYYYGTLEAAPLIKDSPISMECKLVDNYETEDEDNFVLQVVNTYVNEDVLDEDGNIDYEKAKPILFEMPTKSYLETGNKVGKCWSDGKQYK